MTPRLLSHVSVSLSRRAFVRAALGSAVGLSLARHSVGETRMRALAVVRLSEHLVQITGAGANIVVLAQPEGLLLVNGGLAAQHADVLSMLGTTFPGQPVRAVVNTDWHPEHTGLNAHAASVGARIIAHENTRLWLSTEVAVKWQRRTYQPLPKTSLPTQTFYTRHEVVFGRERVIFGHLGQAHTDGDIFVHLTDSDVIVAGDVVTVGRYPVMDYSTGGWIGGLVTATRTIASAAGPATRIVPGEGSVQTLAHVQAELQMLTAVRDRTVKMFKSGMSAAEIIAATPTKEFDATWGSPDVFMRNLYPGLWGHARELGGII
jgi:glyoxylase-like metal-dependent hydrolase (beta-lactamase superfamily II)